MIEITIGVLVVSLLIGGIWGAAGSIKSVHGAAVECKELAEKREDATADTVENIRDAVATLINLRDIRAAKIDAAMFNAPGIFSPATAWREWLGKIDPYFESFYAEFSKRFPESEILLRKVILSVFRVYADYNVRKIPA